MPIERNDLVILLKRIHLFRGVDEIVLSSLLDFFEIVNYPAGDVIYEQGDDANLFYIVYQGRLKVSRYLASDQKSYQMGFLEEGDYFGSEVLAEDWPRQLTIEAVSDVVLLKLDIPNFRALINALPLLSPRLQFVLDSYRLMLSTSFIWLNPEEYVYLVARRHIFFLFLLILPPLALGLVTVPIFLFFGLSGPLATTSLILGVISAIISLAWFVWAWVDWSNDYYIVTNRRVIFQERVVLFYESRQESPMDAVQSTSTSTTQIGRILGYGNVAIRTYIGTILFRGVNDPQQVMGIIQEQQARAQISMQRGEIKLIEKMLKSKLYNLPQDAVQTSKPLTAPIQPSPLQHFLSDMFHLRTQIGDTILYRTHWFILLKKTWLPGALLLGLFFIWLTVVFQVFTLLSLGAATVLIMLVGFFIFLWWGYQYLDWHNDVYLITPEQIVDVNKKPLGKEERQAAPIKNILSIEYKRLGILGLLLNFGTVYIRVGDRQLTFDEVYNPSEVQRELFNRLAARTYADKIAAQEGERKRNAEWFAAYHRVTEREQPPPVPPTRSGF